MQDSTPPDESLLARIGDSDESALLEMMDRYYTHLCKFSHSLLNRNDLVEEAVSSVFLSVWQRRHKLDIKTSLRSYLFSAVGKQSIKMLQRHIRGIDEISSSNFSVDSIAAPDRSDEKILYQEFLHQIEALLNKMPSQRRRVFTMNRLENLRYKEIARRLRISENTVRNHMIKAIEQIEAIRPEFSRILKGDSPLPSDLNQDSGK